MSSTPFQRLRARVTTLWFTKCCGTTLGISGFFVAYFWLLNNPMFPVTVMPLTWLDRVIEFRPEAVFVYVTLWVYVALPAALFPDRKSLVSFGLAALALALVGLTIFLFWPTTLPHFDIDWAQYPNFTKLKTADLAGNACPSLHVAFAVFTAIWLDRQLREMGFGAGMRGINWLWCFGIVYSTVAVRQHVALDALAGAVLGTAVALLHFAVLRRRAPEPGHAVPQGDLSGAEAP